MDKTTNLRAQADRGRILFLDDDPDTCEMMNLMLGYAGYEVVVGRSIAEGLRLTRDKRFDLILLDWYLTDGLGLDLCRAIREFDHHTPIIFYTGMGFEQQIRTALEAGAQGCLVKPVEMETLLMTVANRIGPGNQNLPN